MKIPVSHGHLEAVSRDPRGELRGGGVFCHPHPLHGGTMNTKAVYRAAQSLNELGLRMIRFNFRGVGCSTGTFDEGVGEREDVEAALDWLELSVRDRPMVVGGVSFGSLVGLSVGVDDPRVRALVALGVPVTAYDYGFLAKTEKPVLVVQGENDEFGAGQEVREIMEGYGEHVAVRVIPGSEHLFQGHFQPLQETIRSYFRHGPGQGVLEDVAVAGAEEKP